VDAVHFLDGNDETFCTVDGGLNSLRVTRAFSLNHADDATK
jgi:hypothetical protein